MITFRELFRRLGILFNGQKEEICEYEATLSEEMRKKLKYLSSADAILQMEMEMLMKVVGYVSQLLEKAIEIEGMGSGFEQIAENLKSRAAAMLSANSLSALPWEKPDSSRVAALTFEKPIEAKFEFEDVKTNGKRT